MKKRTAILLFLAVLLVSCGKPTATEALEGGGDTAPRTIELEPAATLDFSQPGVMEEVYCGTEADFPIGQEIAEAYPDTSYEQVMDWYCDGFTFEDILTALETAEQMDMPTDDLLAMLKNGQSWEEIWSEIGLFEE